LRWPASPAACHPPTRLPPNQPPPAPKAENRNRRAGRPILVGQIAVPHVTEDRQVFHVDQIVVELHDVLKLPPDGGKRVFQVLERLHRLQPEIAAELTLFVDPELASYVDDAGRRCDLDHMRIARRLSKRRGVDEPGLAHGICPPIDGAHAQSNRRALLTHRTPPSGSDVALKESLVRKPCRTTARLA